MAQKELQRYRPPVVALMGHIDHGKTSLLDKIRSSHLWDKEAKGITQHITAYQAKVKDKFITFVDTPGHAAFKDMRASGSLVADIAVLVVAATEGIKAQTKESLKFIKQANLPLVVAINKMDLPGAESSKVKSQLVEQGFTPEEYGGQTSVVEISAKTGLGVDQLLDTILLHAEILELKDLPQSPLAAHVIESRLDRAQGPVVYSIIKQGTLSIGDTVYVDQDQFKIKALTSFDGQRLKQALPGTPIEILGFTSVIPVGSIITSQPQPADVGANHDSPQETSPNNSDDIPQLNVVIKADTEGTLKALLASFNTDVLVLSSGTGPITDHDVFIASSGQAQIFGFNVSASKSVKNLAANQQVDIFTSNIIYEIIDNVQAQVLKILEPTIDETITGQAKIIAEFKINKVRIAGVKITDGKLQKGESIHLKRDDKIIKDSKINTLQQGKTEVESVKSGTDCGLTFSPYIDFKVDDVIISYKKS